MHKLTLITDSACDLPLSYLEQNHIKLLPLTVEILGKTYQDIVEIQPKQFYKLLEDPHAIPMTSAINLYTFEETFKEELAKGNEILYIGLSSGMSGTFSFASKAKEAIGSDKIHLIDSKMVAFGLGLLVAEAHRLRELGYSATQIIEFVNQLKYKMDYAVMINNVDILKRSGRISGIQAFAGNLLHIKPVIGVVEGRVTILKKVKGTKSAMTYLVNRLLGQPIDTHYPIIICYGSDEDLCAQLEIRLREVLGACTITSMRIGATVGSHTGSSGIGTFFVKKDNPQ